MHSFCLDWCLNVQNVETHCNKRTIVVGINCHKSYLFKHYTMAIKLAYEYLTFHHEKGIKEPINEIEFEHMNVDFNQFMRETEQLLREQQAQAKAQLTFDKKAVVGTLFLVGACLAGILLTPFSSIINFLASLLLLLLVLAYVFNGIKWMMARYKTDRSFDDYFDDVCYYYHSHYRVVKEVADYKAYLVEVERTLFHSKAQVLQSIRSAQ